jgi:hypothetical protein
MSEDGKYYCDNGDYYYIGSPLAVWKNGRRLSAGTTTVSGPKIGGMFINSGRSYCLYCSTGDYIQTTRWAHVSSATCTGASETCGCPTRNMTGGQIVASMICNKNYDKIKIDIGDGVDLDEEDIGDSTSGESAKPLPKCSESWGKGKIWVEACGYALGKGGLLGCGHAEYGTDAKTFYAEDNVYRKPLYIHTYSKAKQSGASAGEGDWVLMKVDSARYVTTTVDVCIDY